ncbi:MAG TPA: hypothetical protein VFO39_02220 [Candidatus Sulfotelmatobacter sp.]|nr:hypothetical protein [Candidatus Sulfotelmatobacter sp.]
MAATDLCAACGADDVFEMLADIAAFVFVSRVVKVEYTLFDPGCAVKVQPDPVLKNTRSYSASYRVAGEDGLAATVGKAFVPCGRAE